MAEASDDLYAHIMADDGDMIAVGASGSTFVMKRVMRRPAADPKSVAAAAAEQVSDAKPANARAAAAR